VDPVAPLDDEERLGPLEFPSPRLQALLAAMDAHHADVVAFLRQVPRCPGDATAGHVRAHGGRSVGGKAAHRIVRFGTFLLGGDRFTVPIVEHRCTSPLCTVCGKSTVRPMTPAELARRER
jgi:hypothetical protein